MQDQKSDEPKGTIIEGIDFYFEDGMMVLTEKYLLDRGHCCESGCRHCPYGYKRDQSKNTSSSSRSDSAS